MYSHRDNKTSTLTKKIIKCQCCVFLSCNLCHVIGSIQRVSKALFFMDSQQLDHFVQDFYDLCESGEPADDESMDMTIPQWLISHTPKRRKKH